MTGADADRKEVAHPAGVNGEVFDELMSTGAVVAGRGTFEPAGGWGGDHHDGVPIFILYRQQPGIDLEQAAQIAPWAGSCFYAPATTATLAPALVEVDDGSVYECGFVADEIDGSGVCGWRWSLRKFRRACRASLRPPGCRHRRRERGRANNPCHRDPLR